LAICAVALRALRALMFAAMRWSGLSVSRLHKLRVGTTADAGN
jgi:hypothetical protein